MAGLARKYRTILITLVLIMSASPSMNVSALAVPTQRDGIPPVIISAVVDSQRRLEITYKADDGLTYGGTVYLDTDPLNAQTAVKDTRRGDAMYCRTRWKCKTLGISAAPGVGQFTYLSKPLDPSQFPAGTWYVQVATYDRDPDPSFRGTLASNVAVVALTTVSSSASLNVEKLDAISLPINNGSKRCIQIRNRISIGNRLAATINKNVEKLNTLLEKVVKPSEKLIGDLASMTTWIEKVSTMREEDIAVANEVCGATPELSGWDGSFTPIPIPPSNGKAACTNIRNQLNYLNQELAKVVGNMTTTKLNQVVRIRQLEVRFKQLSASLDKAWPKALKACSPV